MAGEILIRIVFTLSDLSTRTVGVEFADFWHNHNHCFAKYHHEGFGVSGNPGDIFHGEIVQQLWDSLVRCNESLETNGHTPWQFSLDVLFMGQLLLALQSVPHT